MLDANVGGLDRLGRAVLAVALTLVAVVALGQGNRSLAVAAGLLGLAAGFNAATCFCAVNEALGIDTTDSE